MLQTRPAPDLSRLDWSQDWLRRIVSRCAAAVLVGSLLGSSPERGAEVRVRIQAEKEMGRGESRARRRCSLELSLGRPIRSGVRAAGLVSMPRMPRGARNAGASRRATTRSRYFAMAVRARLAMSAPPSMRRMAAGRHTGDCRFGPLRAPSAGHHMSSGCLIRSTARAHARGLRLRGRRESAGGGVKSKPPWAVRSGFAYAAATRSASA